MKIRHLLLTMLSVTALFSCSDDYENDVAIHQAPQINIDGSFRHQAETRVKNNLFTDGDQIGLYGVNYEQNNTQAGVLKNEGNQVDNALYTFDGTNMVWKALGKVYYKDVKTNIDLYAYYPYASPKDVHAYEFSVADDQSEQNGIDNFSVSDFLWGKAQNVVPSEKKVPIKFTHKMACASVTLTEGTGFEAGEFAKLKKSVLVMNTTRSAKIDLSDGHVTATGAVASTGIVMKQNTTDFRAVVVPQTVKANQTLFVITVDGITYKYKSDKDLPYQSGKRFDFNIQVNRKSMSGDLEFTLLHSAIEDWEVDNTEHGGEARQYYVVNQKEAGTLGKLIKADKKNPNKIKNLKVCGNIDARDFYFMRDSMEILEAINLKECKICEFINKINLLTYNTNEIPFQAFLYKSSLVYFSFPEKVTKIGNLAFVNTMLSGTLIIPDDVIEIDDSAFSNTNIASLQLPTGLKRIGEAAFYDCKSLGGYLHLPDNLEELGDCAFGYCSGLTGQLILPSKLKVIRRSTFCNCSGLTGSLIIPEGVIEIGYAAFNSCSGLTGQLYLPTTLNKIESYAFQSCNFQGELKIPSQIKEIPGECFYRNDFSTIIFNKDLKKIDKEAFSYNQRLCEPLKFPESLISIEESAFADCYTLPGISLPQNLQTIGPNAFSACYDISSIVSDAKFPPNTLSGAFYGVPKDNFTVEVPEASVVDYQTATGWSEFRRIAAHHEFSLSRPLLRCLNAAYSKEYVLRAPAQANWSIESKPDWVTVSPANGTGKMDVTVTVSDLAQGSANRTGEIVFLLDGKDYRTRMKVEQYNYAYGDGDVITHQTATKGKGVNVVFMGDCFDAKDIAEGRYVDGISEAVGYFFDIEPYKSYKDYFNVYTVLGISPDSGIGTVNTVKDSKFGSQYSLEGITTDMNTCFNYACKAPSVEQSNLSQTLIVMVENTTAYGGICYMWGDGSAIAICPMSRDAYPYDFRGIVQHEAGGHGFGKLADEYIYTNGFIQACNCPNPHVEAFNANKKLGWYKNLSLHGNMEEVDWSHLIFHPKYSNVVDMYEGGFFHSRGVFRSERNSCMNNNIPYYSAISRQAMVERIKDYAGETFNLQDFYDHDVLSVSTKALEFVPTFETYSSASKQMPPKYMGDKPHFTPTNQ